MRFPSKGGKDAQMCALCLVAALAKSAELKGLAVVARRAVRCPSARGGGLLFGYGIGEGSTNSREGFLAKRGERILGPARPWDSSRLRCCGTRQRTATWC